MDLAHGGVVLAAEAEEADAVGEGNHVATAERESVTAIPPNQARRLRPLALMRSLLVRLSFMLLEKALLHSWVHLV